MHSGALLVPVLGGVSSAPRPVALEETLGAPRVHPSSSGCRVGPLGLSSGGSLTAHTSPAPAWGQNVRKATSIMLRVFSKSPRSTGRGVQ